MRVARRILFALLVLAVAIVGLLFGMENGEMTTIQFAARTSPELPLFVWLFVTFFVGVLVGLAIASIAFIRRRAGQRDRRKPTVPES